MSKRMSRYPSDRKVYVGDLGNNARKNELEYVFSEYGTLRSVWIARNPPGFAFVEYEDARDAADAVRGLDGRTVCGRRVRVELSTGKFTNGRVDRRGSNVRNRVRPFHPDDKCYECGGRGHYARDCRRYGRHRRSQSRSRSRSYLRDHRTRSRTGSRSHSRSRSRSQNSSSKRDSSQSRDVKHRSKSRDNYHNGNSGGGSGGGASKGNHERSESDDERTSATTKHHRRNESHSRSPRRSRRSESSRSYSNSRHRSRSRSSYSRSRSNDQNGDN